MLGLWVPDKFKKRRRQRKGASHVSSLTMSPRFYDSRPAQKRNPTTFPRVEQTLNSSRPALALGLRLRFPGLAYFLNNYTTPPPRPRHFLPHPLPPLHPLQSRSKYSCKNFIKSQLKQCPGKRCSRFT